MTINSKPIKDYLTTKAMTQEEFAVEVGISRATVYGILYRQTAAISTVKKLAIAMNISLDELTKQNLTSIKSSQD